MDQPEFELSAKVSEWLFASHFWQDFNANNGTIFDQFEDDEASVAVIHRVVEMLDAKRQKLIAGGVDIIEFTYRWSEDGSPTKTTFELDQLLEEPSMFRNFLADTAQLKLSLMFSL
ncbi:hypothetical protein ACQZ6F_31795 [Rhizobium sp. A22-96]